MGIDADNSTTDADETSALQNATIRCLAHA
jgi:hypothetical protein